MRGAVFQFAVALAAAGGLLSTAGCCAIFCPPNRSTTRHTRDSAASAVRFLADAIQRRAPGEIYESLHPRLIESGGGYSTTDFAAAFELYESEFRSDAERLVRAALSEPAREGEITYVDVRDGDAGATLGFVNVPIARVVLDDEYISEVTVGMPSPAKSFEIAGDLLRLTVPIPLPPGQGAAIPVASVRRVEISDNWLVYDVRDVRGLRIWDVVRNRSGDVQRRTPSR